MPGSLNVDVVGLTFLMLHTGASTFYKPSRFFFDLPFSKKYEGEFKLDSVFREDNGTAEVKAENRDSMSVLLFLTRSNLV